MVGDIQIGKRTAEEVRRLSEESNLSIREYLSKSKIPRSLFYSWDEGMTPGARHLQSLYCQGADVIYILTGRKQ